ncbi:MAG: MFS transporter [Micropepsaceae bacterium]
MTLDRAALKRRAPGILVPALITFSMGQTALFAIAGPVARAIGLSEFAIGIIISSAAVVFVIGSPVWGRISDAWGRKRTIVFGLGSYAISSACFALTMEAGLAGWLTAGAAFGALLALRLTYAALGAGIQPAGVGYMADVSTREERPAAVATIGAAFGIGSILGPALAAALAGFGVLTPLYAIAALGLVATVYVALTLKEPPRHAAAATGGALDMRLIAPLLVLAALSFVGVSAMQQITAFYVQDFLKVDTQAAAKFSGYCFMAMAAAMVLVQGALIPMLKPQPQALLVAGFPTVLAGLGLFAFAQDFWHLVVATALTGAGYGAVQAGLMAAASLSTTEDAQGRAAGAMQGAMSVGFVVGPAAGTALYQADPRYTVVLAAAAALAALVLTLARPRRRAA